MENALSGHKNKSGFGILKTIQRVPGGMMIVPLFIGMALNTLAPDALKIGSFTSALFSNAGLPTVQALQLFFIGTSLRVRDVPEALRRGGVLLIAKWASGALLGIAVGVLFGREGFLGVSVLAIVAAVTGANGSLYMSLMGEYGEPVDVAAEGIMTLHDGPFLALITLGVSGFANVPLMSLLAAVMPLCIGCILGNLDGQISNFFKQGAALVIPFVGFTIGAGINFTNAITAGGSGLVLTCLVFFVGGGLAVLADKLITRRPGYAAAAVATAAGNTIATPAAVALIDPSWQPYVAAATTQIAAAVVITAIVVPFVVSFLANRWGCPKLDAQRAEAEVLPDAEPASELLID